MVNESPPVAKNPPQPPDTTLDRLYKLHREYLNHEHNLINHRLSWNFTIQGFLFTSYAFVLNKAADVRIALSQNTMVRDDLMRASLHDLQVLLFVLGIVGLSVSIAVHFSAWGARRSMDKLKQHLSELVHRDGQTLEDLSLLCGYPVIMGGGDPAATQLGFHAPAILSIVFSSAWVILIVDGLTNY